MTLLVRVLLLGDNDSGKTELHKKLTIPEVNFDHFYKSTQVADFGLNSSNPDIKLELWDVPNSQLESFARSTDLVLYCLDLSKPCDKKKIETQISNFKKLKESVFILVGTKADWDRGVSDQVFEELVNDKEKLFVKGIQLSAKTGKNFSELLPLIYQVVKESNLFQNNQNNFHSQQKNNFFNRPREKSPRWELSNCAITILVCIPVIGWAILLANLIYNRCMTLDNDEVKENGTVLVR